MSVLASATAALALPWVRALYMAFCFAVMIVPLLSLSFWYHGQINATAGGRSLMQRQSRGGPRQIAGISSLAHDIEGGRYGEHAGRCRTEFIFS